MKNEVYLFHEMQEISINLPIIFQILYLVEELFYLETVSKNFDNNQLYGKNW